MDELKLELSRDSAHQINAMLCWLIHPSNKKAKLVTPEQRMAINEYVQSYADIIQNR